MTCADIATSPDFPSSSYRRQKGTTLWLRAFEVMSDPLRVGYRTHRRKESEQSLERRKAAPVGRQYLAAAYGGSPPCRVSFTRRVTCQIWANLSALPISALQANLSAHPSSQSPSSCTVLGLALVPTFSSSVPTPNIYIRSWRQASSRLDGRQWWPSSRCTVWSSPYFSSALR